MMTELTLPSAEPESRPAPTNGPQAALVVFLLASVLAFVVYLVIGRNLWFFRDDWGFLAGRSLNLGDLFKPNGGHLVALPLIAFRVLYTTVGMRTYLPYIAMTITVHVGIAALLRAVMRRANVAPWIATAAAGLYLFFGRGGVNILWAFQITFAGAVAFGLVQMLCADHDGPIVRRDWFGLVAGLAALLCAGVAVPLIGAVGLAVLLRRGWRPALFHTVPLGVLYAAWWWRSDHGMLTTHDPSVLWHWDTRGFATIFGAFGQLDLLGWGFAAMLGVGGYFAYTTRGWEKARVELGPAFALLVAAPVFLTMTGATRWFAGIAGVAASRYLDVMAVLLLPALAVAGDALARRWRVLLPVVIGLFLVGIPGNMSHATDTLPNGKGAQAYQRTMQSLPRSPIATQVPRTMHPDPNQAIWVTVGWLLDNAKSGRLPTSRPRSAREAATDALRLSLEEKALVRSQLRCTRLVEPVERHVERGGTLVVRGFVPVRMRETDGTVSNPVVYSGFLGGGGTKVLTAEVGPLDLLVGSTSSAASSSAPPQICE
jgi:hypothetical protein